VDAGAECVKDLVDGYSVYKVPLAPRGAASHQATTYTAFRSLFTGDGTNLAKAHMILAEFKFAVASEADEIIAKATEQYESLDVLFDLAVTGPDCISVFIYKANFAQLRRHLDLGTHTVSSVLRLQNSKGTGAQAAQRRQLDAFIQRQSLPVVRTGNFLVKNGDEDDAHWTWERAVEYIADFDEKIWISLIANAEGKKADKMQLSEVEHNMLIYRGRLEAHLKPRFEAAMLVRVAATTRPDLSEFLSSVKQLETLEWDYIAGAIAKSDLGTVINSVKCRQKSVLFIGVAGAGKDNLLCALAALCCKRQGVETFMESDGLDPFGAATKAGLTERQGAFVMNDVELTTKLQGRLSLEDVKHLLNVEKPAQFNARYGNAILPPNRPRIFSMNCGKLDDGSVDWSVWFVREELPFVAHILSGSADVARALGEDEKAVLRRMVIVKVDQPLFNTARVSSATALLVARVAAEVAQVPW
jgi:hypothetical protein